MADNTQAIVPMGRDNPEDDHVVGFMCLVDFEYELGMASGGNKIYPSIEDCREHRKCVEACGIVEVRFRRVAQEPREDAE